MDFRINLGSGNWSNKIGQVGLKISSISNTAFQNIKSGYINVSGVWKQFFGYFSLPVANQNDLISIRTGGYNGSIATSPQYINTTLYGHDGSYTNYTSISNRKFVYAANISDTPSTLESDDILNTQANQQTADGNYIWYTLKVSNGSNPANVINPISDPIFMIKQTPSISSISLTSNGGATIYPQTSLNATATIANYWYNSADLTASKVRFWQSNNGSNLNTLLNEYDLGDVSTASGNSRNISVTYSTPNIPTDYLVFQVYLVNSYTTYYSSPVTSTANVYVNAAKPENTVLPTFSLQSGNANETGSTYRISKGTWSNSPTGYKYRWIRPDNVVFASSGSSFITDTYWDFQFTTDSGGFPLYAQVLATNNAGDAVSWAQANGSIGPITQANLTPPTITSVTGSAGGNPSVYFTGGSGPYYQIWWQAGSTIGNVTSYDANGSSSPILVADLSMGSNSTYYFFARSVSALTNTGSGPSPTISAWSSGFQYTSPTIYYTVTWDANGGSVSPSSVSVASGSSTTAPTPTRSGYSFNGWYTASSGGSYVVGAGGSYTPTSTITLYAQWSLGVPGDPSGTSVGSTTQTTNLTTTLTRNSNTNKTQSWNSTGSGSFTISWTGGSGATSHEVYYNTNGATPTSGTGADFSNLGTSYNLNYSYGLSSVNYYYWVRARNSAGTSNWVYVGSKNIPALSMSGFNIRLYRGNGSSFSSPSSPPSSTSISGSYTWSGLTDRGNPATGGEGHYAYANGSVNGDSKTAYSATV